MQNNTAKTQNKNSNTQPQSVWPFDQFNEHIRKAGVDSIIRFLNIDRDELLELSIKDQLTSHIAAAHALMPDADIAAFERDILYTIRQNRENAPIWASIQHDHHEETDGFVIGYVDAWVTSQETEDEEGKVIAQVVGAIVDGKPAVYVAHCDPRARFDTNAKAAVAACTEDILEELHKGVLSNHAQLRRRLLTVGITREFQVLAWIPGVANGDCFAQVNVIGTHSLPQVSRLIPPGLGQDITHRVDQLITEILEEIKAERTN